MILVFPLVVTNRPRIRYKVVSAFPNHGTKFKVWQRRWAWVIGLFSKIEVAQGGRHFVQLNGLI